VTEDRFVAFSDQDDIWHADKLSRQVELIRSQGVDAVSSNVESFDAAGNRHVIVKSHPQRRWDYVFEAAGPGSTYVFTPGMHRQLVGVLAGLDTFEVGVHDWYLYALVRALGGTWVIDPEPLVEYRQHDGNVQGEHRGVSAFAQRLAGLRSGFYRKQFFLTAQSCLTVGADFHDEAWSADLERLIDALVRRDFISRVRIARRFRQIRRNPREGAALAAACVLGVW
jgi:rhamnosyltransferase